MRLLSDQTCMRRKIAIRIDPKENAVNTLSVLKLLFSPQFQRKDVQFHIEATTREHLNLACVKMDETLVD